MLAAIAAIASIAGTTTAYKMIVRHEQRQCDARLEAYRQGRQDAD